MASNTTSDEQVLATAAKGEPIGESRVSQFAAAEAEATGGGPAKGGAAATAQSLHDKQQNFINTAGAVLRKPMGRIDKKDAKDVQKAEEQARRAKPGEDSTSGEVTAVAEDNTRNGYV